MPQTARICSMTFLRHVAPPYHDSLPALHLAAGTHMVGVVVGERARGEVDHCTGPVVAQMHGNHPAVHVQNALGRLAHACQPLCARPPPHVACPPSAGKQAGWWAVCEHVRPQDAKEQSDSTLGHPVNVVSCPCNALSKHGARHPGPDAKPSKTCRVQQHEPWSNILAQDGCCQECIMHPEKFLRGCAL